MKSRGNIQIARKKFKYLIPEKIQKINISKMKVPEINAKFLFFISFPKIKASWYSLIRISENFITPCGIILYFLPM